MPTVHCKEKTAWAFLKTSPFVFYVQKYVKQIRDNMNVSK